MLGKMLATHSKNYQSKLVRVVTENPNRTSVIGEMFVDCYSVATIQLTRESIRRVPLG